MLMITPTAVTAFPCVICPFHHHISIDELLPAPNADFGSFRDISHNLRCIHRCVISPAISDGWRDTDSKRKKTSKFTHFIAKTQCPTTKMHIYVCLLHIIIIMSSNCWRQRPPPCAKVKVKVKLAIVHVRAAHRLSVCGGFPCALCT